MINFTKIFKEYYNRLAAKPFVMIMIAREYLSQTEKHNYQKVVNFNISNVV